MKNILINMIFALVFVAPQIINAQSPRDTLNQYVAELQKNPGDNALREKIILFSFKIKPAPAISDEAREKYVMGMTLRESKDYDLAVAQLKAALLIAPWWGDGYKQYGLTLEFAEKFDEAIAGFQLYIKTQPGEEAVSSTKDEIAIIKAKKMKAENEKEKVKVAATASVQQFEGAWYSERQSGIGTRYREWFHIKKDTNGRLTLLESTDSGTPTPINGLQEIHFVGSELQFKRIRNSHTGEFCASWDVRGTVSPDGRVLTLTNTLLPLSPNLPLSCPLKQFYWSSVDKYTK